MASYGNTVLTSAGIDLVKRVIANTATFEVTKVATSSDSRLTNATMSTIEALTTLPSVQQTGKVTAFDTSNSKQVGLKCEFTNQGLTNQYDICGVGIYAKEAGKSEILFAVAPAKEPETMPAKPNDESALFTFSLNMYVVVGQASAMTITATTEGVVKSINGTIKPDTNGNVTIDDSSHAKFIEAELINGHLLVPLVDDSGNPITDPAGNQLVADEYLPKSIKLGDHEAIYPGTDNTVRLPVYTQAEIDNRLEVKADLLQMEDEHEALQAQITSNANHLDTVDDTLSQHAQKISQNSSKITDAANAISGLNSKMPQAAYVPVVFGGKTDLNDMKTCGFFMIRGETVNSPVGGWVYVKVLGTPDRLTQFAWQDIVPAEQWCRWYDGNSWLPWVHYTKAL